MDPGPSVQGEQDQEVAHKSSVDVENPAQKDEAQKDAPANEFTALQTGLLMLALCVRCKISLTSAMLSQR